MLNIMWSCQLSLFWVELFCRVVTFSAILCLIQMLDLKKFNPFRAFIINQDAHLSKKIEMSQKWILYIQLNVRIWPSHYVYYISLIVLLPDCFITNEIHEIMTLSALSAHVILTCTLGWSECLFRFICSANASVYAMHSERLLETQKKLTF